MFEAFQNLEQVSRYFAPQLVIFPGVLSLVLGLFIWLGGLRWNKLIAVLVGALAGVLLAYWITECQIPTIALAVLVGGGSGMLFKRAVVILVGVVIAAMAVLIITAGPIRETTNPPLAENQLSNIDDSAERLNIKESLRIINLYFHYYTGQIGNAVRKGARSPEGLAFALIGGLAVAAFGFFLPRFTVSAVFSVLGTGLIFIGMLVVLLYKGAQPISHVYERAALYNTVILVMIVFGTAVELLLCSRKNKKPNIVEPNAGER
jgi:hypothetical protein